MFFTVAGDGRDDGATGGNGLGGTIDVSVVNEGAITASALDFDASGFGASSAVQGGDGTGGAISLSDLGGGLQWTSVSANATGFGGGSDAGNGGDAFAGEIRIRLAGQSHAWDSLSLNASAQAGVSFDVGMGASGIATGGPDAVRLTVEGPGAHALAGDAFLTANAETGLDNVTGLTNQAGGVTIEAIEGGDLTIDGSLEIEASARIGGDFAFVESNASPTLRGGSVSILADTGGGLSAGLIDARAAARGMSASTTAGTVTGGTIEVTARNGGAISASSVSGDTGIALSANAYGTPGTLAADAFGGTVRLVAEDGTIATPLDIELTASGVVNDLESFFSPASGLGFEATGGTAVLEVLAGTAGTGTINAPNITVRATGDARMMFSDLTPPAGGEPIQGDGGTGQGGTAIVAVSAGALTTGQML